MKLNCERPHVRALCRDASWWMLASESEPDFTAAWMAGRAFWWGLNMFGEACTIKLADIVGVVVLTEESLALRIAEDEEEKARAALAND